MEFSPKGRATIDACRFCWMCRHICPIGRATGQERNTARARALTLSLAVRGAAEETKELASSFYECALCGACSHDCATGWDPETFTLEARLSAAMDGKLPDGVARLLRNFAETGSVYGKTEPLKEMPGLGRQSGTLLLLGEDARANGLGAKAAELLERLGADFCVLPDEPSSGYSLWFLTGASAETKSVMERCAKALSGYRRVVCYDPADLRVLRREYGAWGVALAPETVSFPAYLAELLGEAGLPAARGTLSFTPQDSAALARSLGETEPVRRVLAACGEVREMLLHGEETVLAGNLIMRAYMPAAMEAVARRRWSDAQSAGARALVTESPAEYCALRAVQPDGIELLTLEEAVLQCLSI